MLCVSLQFLQGKSLESFISSHSHNMETLSINSTWQSTPFWYSVEVHLVYTTFCDHVPKTIHTVLWDKLWLKFLNRSNLSFRLWSDNQGVMEHSKLAKVQLHFGFTTTINSKYCRIGTCMCYQMGLTLLPRPQWVLCEWLIPELMYCKVLVNNSLSILSGLHIVTVSA